MVSAAERKTRHVWHSQPDERYGATKSGGSGRQQPCAKQDKDARPTDLNAQVRGVTFAKQQGVQGFTRSSAAINPPKVQSAKKGRRVLETELKSPMPHMT